MRRRLALALVLVLAAAVAVDPAAVSGKRGKRQRLKNGDRAACACHPVGYLVDAAERACAKHGETDMFELCSAEELAAAGSAEEPEGKPVPPAPPAEATGGDQLLMQATEASKTAVLSPRARAEQVADHVVSVDSAARLSELGNH